MKDFETFQQWQEREQAGKRKKRREIIWTGIIVLVVVLALVAISYIQSSYSSIFARQTAFVYHRDTDSFMVVKLKRNIHPGEFLRFFNPFSPDSLRPCFSEIDSVRFSGRWSEVEEQFKLMDKDIQSWLEKRARWIDKRVEATLSKLKPGQEANKRDQLSIGNVRILGAEFRPRFDLGTGSLIPDAWKPIFASVIQDKEHEECEHDILAADVIIMDGKLAEPVMVNILHGALLVRGMTAEKLSQYCFETSR